MAPPVNRQNELSSRANYYKAYCRENFDGHWNLLGRDGFHLGEEGSMRHGLGGTLSSGGLGFGGGQEGNGYQGGHHHLGGQMAGQYSGQVSGSKKNEDVNESNLQHYMWREEQIEQFVYLIKYGEEKRQWVLMDYEFDDPCKSQGWSEEIQRRIAAFETNANALVKDMYHRRGWTHSSDYEQYDKQSESDEDSDSDSDDDL
jgi:hypothetical protein